MDYEAQLTTDYALKRALYENFTQSVGDVVWQLMLDKEIDHLPIELRTKTIESFKEKVLRPDKSEKYTAFDQVTDLSGIRLITYFQEEREKIVKLIKAHFVIDENNSINKEDSIDVDKFGYRSIHYVVSYNNARLSLPEFQKFKGLKAEIQVRSLLQHTWASIDWKLRYKTDLSIPKELRRRLFRISALLEAADEDFSYLNNKIEEMRQEYEKSIKTGNFSIDLNQDSLELFIENSTAVKSLIKIAKESKYVINPTPSNSRAPYLNLLNTLEIVGISEIAELDQVVADFLRDADKSLRDIFDRWYSPDKPTKLAVDIGSLLRIAVIMSSPAEDAGHIIAECPFGNELQRAIKSLVDEVAT